MRLDIVRLDIVGDPGALHAHGGAGERRQRGRAVALATAGALALVLGVGLGLGAVTACTDAHGAAQPAAPPPVVPHQFRGGEVISARQMNENFAALEQALASANARIAQLEDLLAAASFEPSTSTLVLTGVNLQIRNGGPSTDSEDGTGNLIIGHNDASQARARTGSHNLVIGDDHSYTASGGLAVGGGHTLGAAGAVALGGEENRVEGEAAVIVGGARNRVGRLTPGGQTAHRATMVGSFDSTTDQNLAHVLAARASEVLLAEAAAELRIGERAGTRIEVGTSGQGGVLIAAGASGITQIGPVASLDIRAGRLDIDATQTVDIDSPGISMTAKGATQSSFRLDPLSINALSAGVLFLQGDAVSVEATGARGQLGSGGVNLVAASHHLTRADFIQIQAVGKPVQGASVQIRSKDQLDLRGADVVLAVAEDTGHSMFLD